VATVLTRGGGVVRSQVSVAQFRPEKNHALQLRAFALARQAAVKGELNNTTVSAATARCVRPARWHTQLLDFFELF
jgi:hypothetical protein